MKDVDRRRAGDLGGARPGRPSGVVLYGHGGGFTVGSPSGHRKLAAHLAKALGAHAFVSDYRLAPEHPAFAQLEDGIAAYQGLLDAGFAAARRYHYGERLRGSNLAIGVALEARSKGLPVPGVVIAFSPWIDMQASGGTLLSNRTKDPLVTLEVVGGMAGRVPRRRVATDPRLNPLHADLRAYRTYVNAGGDEALLADAERRASEPKRQESTSPQRLPRSASCFPHGRRPQLRRRPRDPGDRGGVRKVHDDREAVAPSVVDR